MALSDRTNLLVQKYVRRQYPELKECSLNKKGPAFAGPSLGRQHMKQHVSTPSTTEIAT